MILSEKDIELCNKKRDNHNKLLFGFMLGYFKTNINFPSSDKELSRELTIQISSELNTPLTFIENLDWSDRITKRFRKQIRVYLSYREPNSKNSEEFIKYLVEEILPNGPSEALLSEQARQYFENSKVEAFKEKQLQRHINSAKYQFEQNLFQSINNSFSFDDTKLIDKVLLAIEKTSEDGIISLSELKNDIPGARIKHVNYAIKRIELLNKIKIPKSILENINRKVLVGYYDRIMALSPSNILEFNTNAKYGIMAIFFHIKLQIMLDLLADTFIKLVHRMRTSATKFVDKNLLKEIKRVEGKLNILEKLAVTSVKNPDHSIKDKIYQAVSKEKLLEVINDLKHRGKWYEQQIQTKIHSNYAHGSRIVLLAILKTLLLKEDHKDYKPILEAIDFIKKFANESDSENYLTTPPIKDVISSDWEYMIVIKTKKKEVINKYNYEIAVLEKLKELLVYKAIWIENSYRYRNPNDDTPKDYDAKKEEYCQMLGLPTTAKVFIDQLKTLQKDKLKSLNYSILNNELVKIKQNTTKKNILITPSEAQQEPENIDKLQNEIVKQFLSINLIDILKECDLLIDFTNEMKTIARSSNISQDDLRKRLLLCIYGIGSNTGLKRISIANGDVKYSDLRYVKKRFINKTNLSNAIRVIVNKVLDIRDKRVWKEATTTVACDSTQVSAWDQNLINEWHYRYKGKGVMIYWHVDKKALCIYSQLKSCSSSEVGSMIKGVIDHDTAMNMNRVFVDTHGQSVLGFAVSYLLGFDLLPRFKGINTQKLCGVTSDDKNIYPNIAKIIKGTINWKLIEENYDEVLKYIVALKLGIIEPSVLVKRFSKENYTHPIYKAFIEIGKANRTIFLCNYLESEELRIEINEGLNVVERLNNVMDFIFYGKLGELKTNKTDEQELSVLCLHLLQACMVYINTLIIQQTIFKLDLLKKFGEADYRALTPLLSAHINPYGLFPIDFNSRISINTELSSEVR